MLYTGKKSILLKYCYSCSSISITFCESFLGFEITESCDPTLINATWTKIEKKKFGAILDLMKDDIMEIAFTVKGFPEISGYSVYMLWTGGIFSRHLAWLY